MGAAGNGDGVHRSEGMSREGVAFIIDCLEAVCGIASPCRHEVKGEVCLAKHARNTYRYPSLSDSDCNDCEHILLDTIQHCHRCSLSRNVIWIGAECDEFKLCEGKHAALKVEELAAGMRKKDA